MNPEFQRNLWLEAGPRRLSWAGVVLASIFGASLLIDHRAPLSSLGVAGCIVFVIAGLLWGPRIAGRAVGDEVGQRTWDFQRLSALEPWDMTWGKLFGATSLTWIAALSGLALAALWLLDTAGPTAALQAVVAALGAAVLLQAGSMALALVGVRRARAEGRSAAFRVTFAGIVGLFIVASAIGRTTRYSQPGRGPLAWVLGPGGAQDWWGLAIPPAWFAALSLAVFAGWALLGAWRLMRLELQMLNWPWAWPGFCVFAGLWAAGFAHGGGERWAAAGLVFAICAYAAAFAEPADRVRLRQFAASAAAGAYRRAAFAAPAALAPLALSAVAVAGIALSGRGVALPGRGAPAPTLALAAFAFMVRDLGLVAYFRFGPRPGRGDFGAIVALFLAYFVGGVLAANLGGASGLGVFVPQDSFASAASGAAMAVIVWALTWKRIRGAERSEASP